MDVKSPPFINLFTVPDPQNSWALADEAGDPQSQQTEGWQAAWNKFAQRPWPENFDRKGGAKTQQKCLKKQELLT